MKGDQYESFAYDLFRYLSFTTYLNSPVNLATYTAFSFNEVNTFTDF